MRRAGPLLLVSLLALVLGACASARGAPASDATITIRYSHFAPAPITARVGEPVTITLRNDDPIEHEWIVGTEEVHERHRTGAEPYHAEVPSEVTVPALSTRVSTLTFAEPGDYLYICHLPGHEAYGMVGTLRVE